MRFEWDSEKAAENLRKHRISFDEAATAFFDPLSMTVPDPDHSVGERRFITMGASSGGRLVVVAHTERGSHPSNHQCTIGQRLGAQTL
jgi:uncharacterized protein